jgi:hypothetical protein
MGQVLSFKPSETELQEAWEAFDAARINVERLYAWPVNSTPEQRFAACMTMNECHRRFTRLCARMETAQ